MLFQELPSSCCGPLCARFNATFPCCSSLTYSSVNAYHTVQLGVKCGCRTQGWNFTFFNWWWSTQFVGQWSTKFLCLCTTSETSQEFKLFGEVGNICNTCFLFLLKLNVFKFSVTSHSLPTVDALLEYINMIYF